MWSVLAGAPVPEPRLAGLTVGLLTKPPSVGGAALPENRAAEQYVERLEELGARVVEARDARAARRHVAALLPRSRGVAPRDVPGARRRVRRQRARQARARADDRARRGRARARGRPRAGATYRPPVDLYVAPVLGVELPPVDCDELEVRIPLTAFLRPFNVLGWAALAIGDLQLVAPRDEVVLAAGLAWEREA